MVEPIIVVEFTPIPELQRGRDDISPYILDGLEDLVPFFGIPLLLSLSKDSGIV